MIRPALALLGAALCACQDWQPPGDGVAKGCQEQASFDRPIAHTLGFSSHLDQDDDESSRARRDFELAGWQEIGVGIVRRDIHWHEVEPERGSFDFSGPDVFVEAAEQADAEPLGLLVYGNPWASSAGDENAYPPDDPDDYAEFAVQVARHYGSRIRRYEIWNEPNAGVRFWLPVEDPAAYAALFVAAAQALHDEDPELQVGLGSLFLPDLLVNTPGLEFLEAALQADPQLLEHADALAVHPYRYPFTAPEVRNEWQGSWLDDLCQTRELLESHGAGQLPLWVTEMGWHTAADALFEGVSPQDQAAFLLRSFLSGLSHGQQMYLWYTFADGGDDSGDQEQMFGLWGYDADPTQEPAAEAKPGVAAWKNLVQVLGQHDQVADRSAWLGLDDQTWAYELSGGQGSAWALWSSAELTAVRIPGEGSATLLDMMGGEEEIQAEGGHFMVHMGGEPHYLLLP